MASSNTACHLAGDLAHLAAASLIAEARLTPKPGLVDCATNGAHTDMDLSTFMASAAALEPLFAEYAAAGASLGADGPAALARAMRDIGIRAEAAMFAATDGVNTHKGANFTFALVLGATGALMDGGGIGTDAPEGAAGTLDARDTETVLNLVSRMGAGLLDHDVRALHERMSSAGNAVQLSHGEQLLLSRGMQGVRGEAARGYPQLSHTLLPYLRSHPLDSHRAGAARIVLLRALVKLMADLEDTNVVHRGGPEALTAHRAFCRALDARDVPDEELIATLAAYDAELIRTNVSPGGAADLLSLGVFFALLEGLITTSDIAY